MLVTAWILLLSTFNAVCPNFKSPATRTPIRSHMLETVAFDFAFSVLDDSSPTVVVRTAATATPQPNYKVSQSPKTYH